MILPSEDLAHVLQNMRSWERLRGKRIFVTGSSGFVGRWLTETFGCANSALDLKATLVKVPRDTLPSGHFDLGIHAARADRLETDVLLSRRILAFAKSIDVSRILFTSSGAVYGRLPPALSHVPEDLAPAPESDYGKAKLASELLLSDCCVIARMFAFTGPALPLDVNFAVGNFVRDVMNGDLIEIQGDGTARRSYLYAADLAIWLWTLLLEGQIGRPYNVGSPESISILELAQRVAANTQPKTRIAIHGGGGSNVYVPSVERARSELNLRPLIGLNEGIRRMYAWNCASKVGEAGLLQPTLL